MRGRPYNSQGMIETLFEQPVVEQRPSQPRLKLGWALGLSIALHLTILLLGTSMVLLRGVPTPVAAEPPPEKSLLRFTFAQVPEPKAEEPQPPAGEVPVPVDEPAPKPRPSADLRPPPPDPGEPRPAEPLPSEPTEHTAELGGALEEGGGETAQAEEQARRSAAEQRADAEIRRPETSKSGFDLHGAIQDFGKALDRAGGAVPNPKEGSGPPRNVFVPNAADLPTTGFGVGNLTFESRDFDWSDYARSIYWEIWRAWHNRLLRLASDFERWSYDNREPDLYHEVRVRFVIENTGEVTDISVETPSGCIPLDESATQALAEALLPALPADFPKEREVVHARFLARGEVRALRPHLERLKALNYF